MDLTTLRSDARYKALGDSSNTEYATTDVDRNLNKYYHKAGEIAVENGGSWEPFGEIVTIDIVEDANNEGYIQQEYLLTDDLNSDSYEVYVRRIRRVFIKTDADNDYTRAKKVDISKLEEDISEYTPSSFEYDMLEDSIFILLPNYEYDEDITAGIKLYVQTDITKLVDTSDVPQLPTVFQDYITTGSAYEYCVANEQYAKSERFKRDLKEMEEEMANHFASRSESKQPVLEPEELNLY